MKKYRINIFLSWSGGSSREIARVMAEWLANLSPNIQTFVGGDEIEMGSHWLDQVKRTISSCDVAILILTKQNSPWMNFEAGYLSAKAEEKELKIMPMLFGVAREEIPGPFNIYQSVDFSEQSIYKVSKSILSILEQDESKTTIIKNLIHSEFPELNAKIASILSRGKETEENIKSDSKRASSSFLESWRKNIDD